MRFAPQKSQSQKSEKSVSGGTCLASIVDANEPAAGGGGGISGVGAMPHREPIGIETVKQPQEHIAKKVREQLAGICTLRSAAINAALNVKGAFGDGFEAYMGHLLRTKPELALGFLKPMMMMGLEGSGGAVAERAPILIVQSGATANIQTANIVREAA
jgi:hypothetical protein